MDGMFLLRLERCLGCQSLFLICRCCYHGHTYCSDDCRKPARTLQLRGIRAAHQASPGGRKDHRDRNRELRKRDRELRKRAASMTSRPTAFLKTSPHSTKVLVRLDGNEVLKAALLTPRTPHPRALPTLLE